jgi:hypothetical protein
MPSKTAKPVRQDGKRSIEYYDESGNKTTTHVGGEVSWRNNNPGNLKWDGKSNSGFFKDKLGAIGSDGTFAIFPSWEDGVTAKANLMKVDGKYKGKTISEAMELYAPRSENDTDAYLAFIKQRSGVDPTKKVDELSPDEYGKFMGAIRDYESSAGRGSPRGKGTVIDHTGQDGTTQSVPDLSTLRPEPRPEAQPAAPESGDTPGDQIDGAPKPQEQKGPMGPSDPRASDMVTLASTPVTNSGQSALLKRTDTLTQPEMMDMIRSAQGDFTGTRSGDPAKARLYEAAQDWHSHFYGDGEQRLEGGKPVTPVPIVAIPDDPAPHITADGNDLWQASARMGSKVAAASDIDGYGGAVKGLQRGLNMLNDANPEIRRSTAWGDYTKQEKVAEDGQYGPQTDFGMKQALARHGEDKMDGALALGRFNVFARQAGQDGNADDLESKTASLFGDQAGRSLQKTLNQVGADERNDWQPLVEDNWIGPKTTQAFAGLMGDTDPDSFTQSFGQGLGLL